MHLMQFFILGSGVPRLPPHYLWGHQEVEVMDSDQRGDSTPKVKHPFRVRAMYISTKQGFLFFFFLFIYFFKQGFLMFLLPCTSLTV